MKTRLLIYTVAALIPLGAAVAGDQYGSKNDKSAAAESFKKLDTNKDGRISQAEAAADSTVVFSSADTNGDGYIDSAEWKASSKGSNTPQSQSQDSTASETPSTDTQGVPPSSDRAPDTETPKQ